MKSLETNDAVSDPKKKWEKPELNRDGVETETKAGFFDVIVENLFYNDS